MNQSANSPPEYKSIIDHYELCFQKHGDTCRGVDWPNEEDERKRNRVMLDVIREKQANPGLLDFGCGTSRLYEYIQEQGLNAIRYAGLDISPVFVNAAAKKFPDITYYCLDILQQNTLPQFDYIVMNGVFTEKCALSFDEMWRYFQKMMHKVFEKAQVGVAFNLMSKQVDWERSDLFHVPMDLLARFLKTEISRHFVFRHEYGLYEYTVYVYRSPVAT